MSGIIMRWDFNILIYSLIQYQNSFVLLEKGYKWPTGSLCEIYKLPLEALVSNLRAFPIRNRLSFGNSHTPPPLAKGVLDTIPLKDMQLLFLLPWKRCWRRWSIFGSVTETKYSNIMSTGTLLRVRGGSRHRRRSHVTNCEQLITSYPLWNRRKRAQFVLPWF